MAERASVRLRLLVTGQTINVLGSGLAPIAIAFAVLDATGSVSSLGFVTAARELAALGLGIWGGAIVARSSIRLSLTVSNCVAGVGQIGMAIAADQALGGASVLALFALINGAMASISGPATFALLGSLSREDGQRVAVSMFRVASTSGLFVGAAIGGLLVALLGSSAALLIDASTFLSAAACFNLAARAEKSPPTPPPAAGRRLDPRRGYKELRSRGWAWRIVLTSAVANGIETAILAVLGPAIALRSASIGPGAWGVVLAASGLGSIAGATCAGFLRIAHPLRVSLIGCFGESLPLFCLALHPQFGALCAAQFLAGVGFGIFEVAWMVILQTEFDTSVLPHVYAWDQVISGVFVPPSQVVIGPLSHTFGQRTVILAGASLVAVSVPWQLSDKRVRAR